MGRSLVKVLCMMMLAAVAAVGVSCSRPASYEKFVSVEDREANGLLAVLGFFPEEPVFTLAEVHDEDKRDLAGGRKILVSSDAHRLWEISDGSFCVHLDVSPEAGEEAVREAFFAMLEKKS